MTQPYPPTPTARITPNAPQELSATPHIRYDGASAQILYPVSGLTAMMYFILAAAHPFFIPGLNGKIMSIIAFASGTMLITLAIWTRKQPQIGNATFFLSVVFLIMIINSELHLYLTQQDIQTTNFMLILIAAGMAIINMPWNIFIVATSWFAWCVGMMNNPNAAWSHWFIAMILATLVGQLMRHARKKSLDKAATAYTIQKQLLEQTEQLAENQKQLLEQAEQLAENRRTLLSTISHDIRTPVTGIVTMADLLLQQPLNAKTLELVQSVQYSAHGLTTMLNNLLDLARIESGKLEICTEPVNPCQTLNEVLQMVGPIAQNKHLPVIGAATANVPHTINTDPARLKQIILNLLSNSIKFTDEGAVTVIADFTPQPTKETTLGQLTFTVTDTGPGMTPEQTTKIFESYTQATNQTHQKHGGAGLGLTISQQLATLLGGTLTVQSTPGEGTTFTLTLPVTTNNNEQPSPTVPYKLNQNVVIKGNPLAVKAAQTAFTTLGYTILDECPTTPQPHTIHIAIMGEEQTTKRETKNPKRMFPNDNHPLIVCAPATSAAAHPNYGQGAYIPLPWRMETLQTILNHPAAQQTSPGNNPSQNPSQTPQNLTLPDNMKILFAENDTVNRNLITELLTKLGAQVTPVRDGAEAVEEIARDKYNLALMDVNMPVMNGIEATRIIRERLADTDTLPILVFTADEGWKNTATYTSAGFNGYILKPATLQDLHTGITKTLARTQPPPTSPNPENSNTENPQPSPKLQTFNPATTQQLVEDLNDATLVNDTIAVFLEELPQRTLAIYENYTHGSSPEETKAAAHTLKGASAMLGLEKLAHHCQTMETNPTETTLHNIIAEAENAERTLHENLPIQQPPKTPTAE